ncbi:hypothetical protein ABEB36_006458 [Hypothenemus hampei]|uniref:Nucleoporin NUP42 n=1 Tax=Hypothenemus hampei TaxID=57062 RepID=A0ABD1ETK2_HYPHA
MTVCKYFLQGNCRFGNNCHFSHEIGGSFHRPTSIVQQSSFAPVQPVVTDINSVVKTVVSDITGAEKGGQWLLSFYAPFKEKPAFPGFEDYSPEEIRWGFYNAQKTGAVAEYTAQVGNLLKTTLAKINSLKNPSIEVVNILQQIYNSPPASLSGTIGQGAFATGQQQSNIFATQTNSGNNIFGGNSVSNNPTNCFAVQSRDTSASSGGNIFANSSSTSGNIFASSNPTSGNIFATSNPVQTTSSPFVSSNNFQGQQTNASLFNNQNVFAQRPPATQSAQNYSASIFRSVNSTSNAIDLTSSTTSEENIMAFYSKIEELTEEEKGWFESDNLDLLHIPLKPPCYEMCFPTMKK